MSWELGMRAQFGRFAIFGAGFLLAGSLLSTPVLADDYCPDPSKPCSSRSPEVQHLRRDKVMKIYNYLIYPTPLRILSTPPQLSVDDLFEQAYISGRVTPIGEFPGFVVAQEYFYGLASANTRVEYVSFTSLVASDDRVGVQVNIFFCQQASPCANGPVGQKPGYGYTLTQTGFFIFNGNNRVIAFDLSILNLGAAVDPTTDQQRESAILQTCGLLTLFPNTRLNGAPGTCTNTFGLASSYPGGNAVSNYTYNPSLNIPFPGVSNTTGPAFSNCVAFMHTIPYGSWNRANSNTFVCRQLHSLLTLFRPDIHCPHTSPNGAMTCVDFPYASFYDTTFGAEPPSSGHRHH
jgi:hypothetical protein